MSLIDVLQEKPEDAALGLGCDEISQYSHIYLNTYYVLKYNIGRVNSLLADHISCSILLCHMEVNCV